MGRRLDASRIETRMIPIEAIEDHPRNYNAHPEAQVAQLAESHKEFGQYRTILVWARPGGKYIRVVGHGYSAGARKTGETMLRAEILPEDTPPDVVEAIMLADNLHAQNSSPDEELLAQLLQEQADAGYDLAALGTDSETLRQMLAGAGDFVLPEGEEWEEGAGGDDFDVSLEEEGPTRTHPGELWALGNHRLLVGDCTDLENVRRVMSGELADCCWTDPPYGVSYVGKTKDALTIQNDGKEDIESFLRRAFAATDTALEEGAAIYIAHPAGQLSFTFGQCFLAQAWRLHQTLIWVKDSMVLGHSDYHYRHEPILYGYKPGGGRHGRGGEGWYGDNSQTSVFDIARPKRSTEHPTMKPVALVEAMIRNSVPYHGVIYDPFGGSGTTLIAAQRLRRRCHTIELDPRYADVVLSRYEAETEKQAELLEEGEEEWAED